MHSLLKKSDSSVDPSEQAMYVNIPIPCIHWAPNTPMLKPTSLQKTESRNRRQGTAEVTLWPPAAGVRHARVPG